MVRPLTVFGTDADLERSGVVLDFGNVEGVGELWIKVRRAGGRNRAFEQYLEAAAKPHKFRIQTDTLDPEIDKRLTMEAYSKTVVVDWSWFDEDGSPLECTPENITALFEADPDLYAEVRRGATAISNFMAESRRGDEKNSKAGSRGRGSGAASKKS